MISLSIGEKRINVRHFLVMCVTVRRFEFAKILVVSLFFQSEFKKVFSLRIYTDRHTN